MRTLMDRHQIAPYPIRMPAELRQHLEEAARAASRSLHAEIISRLERTMSDAPAVNGIGMREIFEKLAELEAAVKAGASPQPFSQTSAGKEWKRKSTGGKE